jgi:hypothetical protein
MDDRTRVVGKELEVGQERARLVEGCGVKEVIGDVAQPRDAVDHAPMSGNAPVLKGREVRDQRRRERLPQRVEVGHIDAAGDGEKDGEHRKVRVRVIELEAHAAGRFSGSRVVLLSARLGGARDLIRLGAWEEGEQVFRASSWQRADEADEPLVDSSAVVRTVLGEGHDVGVIKGIDDAAVDGFLAFRDQRERHLVDEAHVHKREALVSVRVVQNGAADGRGCVDSEELLESTVRGGNPRGAADGEELEEAFATLLANALAVLLSGVEHDANQKDRKRRRGSTLRSNANANEERVRDRLDSTKKMELGAKEREFEHSEHFGGTLEPQEAPMVTERQAEAPKGAEKAQNLSNCMVYSDSSRGSRKK